MFVKTANIFRYKMSTYTPALLLVALVTIGDFYLAGSAARVHRQNKIRQAEQQQQSSLTSSYFGTGQWLKWLSLASGIGIGNRNATPNDCSRLSSILTKRQRQLCSSQPDVLPFLSIAADMALAECQTQFKDRRWNCSVDSDLQRRIMSAVISEGTREAAFLHALASAAVSHSLTRACSAGLLPSLCACDATLQGPSTETSFIWGGCSDNVNFGNSLSRQFVDAYDRDRIAKRRRQQRNFDVGAGGGGGGGGVKRVLMNLHNQEVGRKTLIETTMLTCKCHGVSGSCEVKTCWRTLTPFRHIGDVIKEKFDGATEVSRVKLEGKNFVLEPKNTQLKRNAPSELVYYAPSPDFCERDDRLGSAGTHGRVCNATSNGADSCELMCCGRDYGVQVRKEVRRCRCRFVWCCRVVCDNCEDQVEETVCK